MKYVLGVDIGTGSVKAVAVDPQGTSFEMCQQYYGFNVPQPGFHEQDPDEVWQSFVKVITEVVAKIGEQPLG
ncbi:MAG: gluconokinase, partial [Pedobacter sp.]